MEINNTNTLEDIRLVFDKQMSINGDVSKAIYNQIVESGKTEVILVNIGTDIVIGDSLGPLIGSNLLNRLDNIHIYGTLESPVTARNINRIVEDISLLHKDAFVIAVDACVGEKPDIGSIVYTNKPIQAGAAFRDDLASVGDCSIKGVVSADLGMEFFMKNIRLSFVIELARKIENELLLLDTLLNLRLTKNEIIENYAM